MARSSTPEAREILAGGTVLWRPGPAGPLIALVHRPRYDDWSFPKGKRLPGEHVLVTAGREVCEETGTAVLLGRRLSTARYSSDGLPKRVDYWAARPAGENRAGPGRFVPNAEVDDLIWLPATQAGDRLTYAHDVTVLEEFCAGPAATTPLILVRHAVARGKKAWREDGNTDDLPRPLTARGRAQAQALSEVLACFGPAQVISSAAERCLATVRPYAARYGATVVAEPAFTLTGAPPERAGDPTRGADQAARDTIGEITAGREPAVICAHRENLPLLLAAACERFGAPAPDGPPLRKGAFWVLQVSDGTLASAEQHHVGGRQHDSAVH